VTLYQKQARVFGNALEAIDANLTTTPHWNSFLAVFVSKVHHLPRLLASLHLPLRIIVITHLNEADIQEQEEEEHLPTIAPETEEEVDAMN
jgi:hypothetical protein